MFLSSLMHCTFAHPQPASWPTLYKAALNPCASEHLTPNREMLCQIPEASSLILQYLPLPQYLQIQYTTWIKVFHCYKIFVIKNEKGYSLSSLLLLE